MSRCKTSSLVVCASLFQGQKSDNHHSQKFYFPSSSAVARQYAPYVLLLKKCTPSIYLPGFDYRVSRTDIYASLTLAALAIRFFGTWLKGMLV